MVLLNFRIMIYFVEKKIPQHFMYSITYTICPRQGNQEKCNTQCTRISGSFRIRRDQLLIFYYWDYHNLLIYSLIPHVVSEFTFSRNTLMIWKKILRTTNFKIQTSIDNVIPFCFLKIQHIELFL